MGEISDLLAQFRHWASQPSTNEGLLYCAALIVWLGTWAIHNTFKATLKLMQRDVTQRLEQIQQSVELWRQDWKNAPRPRASRRK